jgi:hypothetical protein
VPPAHQPPPATPKKLVPARIKPPGPAPSGPLVKKHTVDKVCAPSPVTPKSNPNAATTMNRRNVFMGGFAIV